MPIPTFLVLIPTLSIFCHLACPPGICFPFIAIDLHFYLSCCQNNFLHFPIIVHGHNTILNVAKSPHIYCTSDDIYSQTIFCNKSALMVPRLYFMYYHLVFKSLVQKEEKVSSVHHRFTQKLTLYSEHFFYHKHLGTQEDNVVSGIIPQMRTTSVSPLFSGEVS